MKIYTPFIDHIVEVSSRLKRPTARLIVTRIADDLLQCARRVAELELPPIIRANLDDPWVQQNISGIELAKTLVGTQQSIRSFDEAWRWLRHVTDVASVGNKLKGVDSVLMFVHQLVSLELRVMDFELMALFLDEER